MGEKCIGAAVASVCVLRKKKGGSSTAGPSSLLILMGC